MSSCRKLRKWDASSFVMEENTIGIKTRAPAWHNTTGATAPRDQGVSGPEHLEEAFLIPNAYQAPILKRSF